MLMPKINIERFKPEEVNLVKELITNVGKHKGRLRAGKPKMIFTTFNHNGYEYKKLDDKCGIVNYLWHKVVTSLKRKDYHATEPYLAVYRLPGNESERTVLQSKLDKLANKIIGSIGKS